MLDAVRSRLVPSLGVVLFACAMSSACGGKSTPSSPTPSQPSPTTFLAFTSEPGDSVGRGETHRYNLADGRWDAQVAMSGVTETKIIVFTVFPSDNSMRWWWSLIIAPPFTEQLKVGTYEDTRDVFEDTELPGLEFYGSGHKCSRSRGRFVIHEIAWGPGNTIDRLHVTFTQRCQGSQAALNGELSIVANPWR